MSHHEKHHESHKEHKKAQIKKNRHNQEIFQTVVLQQRETERVKDLQQSVAAPSAAPSGNDEAWTSKMEGIRNKLTGQKRASTDRWNRFAGTSGGGGRGR